MKKCGFKNRLLDILNITFPHPAESYTCGYVIIEKPVTREEYERCMKLLEEWAD